MDALIRVEVPSDTPDPTIMRQKVESESYEKLRRTDKKAIYIRTLCIYAKSLCIIPNGLSCSAKPKASAPVCDHVS